MPAHIDGTATIDEHSVHIWRVHLPETPEWAKTELLSDQEKARLNNFAHDSLRHLYFAVHTAKREILASYLNISAKELALVESEHGKPQLDASTGMRLEFNITHTTGAGVIAIARSMQVGVDLESLDRRVDALPIARRYFDKETLEQLEDRSGKDQAALFLRYWTQYEAYKKATGLGLVGGDHPLHLTPTSQKNRFEPIADPLLKPGWLVAELDTLPEHALSVVVPTTDGITPGLQHFDYYHC